MKIITRYVLKEHIGPFVFALSALTSLLLLQYIARRFGDLVGRGLSWQVITEFFLLSIPFTLAMTLPMSVLVAVLYAFSRLASENEITALKAGGVSSRALMVPAVVASVFLALFMLYFNDQLLPRANHQLATLQMAILRTKPTFALKPQVINTIREGQLYLRAGHIDEATGLMQDVTIYDLTDSRRRRTIYADSGTLTLAENRRDLSMHLYKGWMLTAPDERPGQITRIYYGEDVLKVRDVANQFQMISADTSMKGDREMSVCEMQRGYEAAHGSVRRARYDSVLAVWHHEQQNGLTTPMPTPDSSDLKAGGLGAVYCDMVNRYFKKSFFTVKEAQAAELPVRLLEQQQQQQQQQDSAKQQQQPKIVVVVNGQNVMVPRDSIPDDAYDHTGRPIGKRAMQKALMDSIARAKGDTLPPTVPTPGGASATPMPVPGAIESTPAPTPNPAVSTTAAPPDANSPTVDRTASPEILEAKSRLDDARYRRNRYGIEIQKKFSLAFACIVFVLVGAPIALRFPRGGVGLVIGVSFFVFAVYYVGLIGGESLANKNIIRPALAMWVDNIIFLIVGIVLISRMGKEGATARGGQWSETMDSARLWFARQGRRVGIGRRAAT